MRARCQMLRTHLCAIWNTDHGIKQQNFLTNNVSLKECNNNYDITVITIYLTILMHSEMWAFISGFPYLYFHIVKIIFSHSNNKAISNRVCGYCPQASELLQMREKWRLTTKILPQCVQKPECTGTSLLEPWRLTMTN